MCARVCVCARAWVCVRGWVCVRVCVKCACLKPLSLIFCPTGPSEISDTLLSIRARRHQEQSTSPHPQDCVLVLVRKTNTNATRSLKRGIKSLVPIRAAAGKEVKDSRYVLQLKTLTLQLAVTFSFFFLSFFSFFVPDSDLIQISN